jgi:phosphohistidine swiveling domain-containing protein
VVGVSRATSRLRDGQRVRVDGGIGLVTVLSAVDGSPTADVTS